MVVKVVITSLKVLELESESFWFWIIIASICFKIHIFLLHHCLDRYYLTVVPIETNTLHDVSIYMFP